MKSRQAVVDKAAIGLSALCIAHCLLLPVLTVLLPVLIALPIADEGFHLLLVWFVLPTSLFALTMGCRKHQHWPIFYWGSLGLVILIFTALFGHDLFGELGEKLVTVLGSSLIIYSHYRNYKLCNTASCEG